ncbi:MAG: PQQ-binding-like beta-propeller repeat protein, partial [Dokdonella sp.]
MKHTWLIVALLSIALGGCNWIKGLGRKDNVEPPTPLSELTAATNVQPLWSASVGKGAGVSGARMAPAIVGDRLYTAGVDGVVQAIDANSGRTLWTIRDKMQRWAGGPA